MVKENRHISSLGFILRTSIPLLIIVVFFPITGFSQAGQWEWVSGGNGPNQLGVYGTKGVADANNIPGARSNSISWTDASGDLWLFGGIGYDDAGSATLNDLWKFDGANWTWVSGSNGPNQLGVYGTKGVADANNIPGARSNSISWTDASGNLWLFGGIGYASTGTSGRLNDLWRYDGTNWTWISGSDIKNQTSNYGLKGVSDSNNIPGARVHATSWIDDNDILWLFGGDGVSGYFNDLWKFDGTDWTWVTGSNIIDQPGIFGTKGISEAANTPGARVGSISWTDNTGVLWLFGGYGFGAISQGCLNDLWKFDGANWTWVSGSNAVNEIGNYGVRGVLSPSNIPGARLSSVSFKDKLGNLWFLGGSGYDNNGNPGVLNDLWKFDGVDWTWISGSDIRYQPPRYGEKGTPDLNNVPGARDMAICWTNSSGDFWLFGGSGYYTSGGSGSLNDLWKIEDFTSATDFISFNLPEETEPATIDAINHTINVKVAYGVDVSLLTPTFTLANGGFAKVGSVTQISGSSANDYTTSVIYTITADDGLVTQDWTISVDNSFSSVLDIDGNIYTTAKMGAQWWMLENLKTVTYNDGTAISSVWPSSSNGAYASYNNGDPYGVLYNWYAVNTDNVCPVGWKVPSDDEWKSLEMSLGMSQAEADSYRWRGNNEGGKLKEAGTAHWIGPNTGATDEVSFTALPGGAVGSDGTFLTIGEAGYWWAANEANSSEAWCRVLSYSLGTISRDYFLKRNGFSVRCMRKVDIETDILSYNIPEEIGSASIDPINHTVAAVVTTGTDLTALISTFTLSTGASAKVGEITQISGTTHNDFTNPVTYSITAEDGVSSQDWMVSVSSIIPNSETDILSFTFQEETTSSIIDTLNHTVDIKVVPGTDISSLTSIFTISDGANATINSVSQISGSTVNDFTNPIIYTITAEDGISNQDWIVSATNALNAEAEITAFSVPEQTGTTSIDTLNHTVTIKVVKGTDVTSLISTFVLSDGANATVNSIAQVSGATSNDYTNPVTYIITAEDGVSIQDWIVSATVVLNVEAEITAFSVPEQTGTTSIDTLNHSVTIKVVKGTDVTSLISTFVLSDGANATVNSIAQVSGATSNDYTNPVTYIITAEDGVSIQNWIVSATIALNAEAEITAFSVPEQTGTASIDTQNHTVTIKVAKGTDVTSLISTFVLSDGANATVNSVVQISGATSNDFTSPVTYTITAEDGVIAQDWIVSVSIDDFGIVSTVLPVVYTSGLENELASVTVISKEAVQSTIFKSKLITNGSFGDNFISSSTDTYEFAIDESQIGDRGLEYFFLIEGKNGDVISTDTTLIGVQYSVSNAPVIPSLVQGGKPEHWRMFSIPYELENNSIQSLIEPSLGTYDITKWRLVHYKNDNEIFIEYKSGLSNIERSKGYWFNSKEEAIIRMGPSITPNVSENNLSSINLQQGWNQIGNPYTFDVLWSDVLTFNSAIGVSTLRIFKGGTQLMNSDVLVAYTGAYVFSDQNVTLEIPISSATGGRISKDGDIRNSWYVNLGVETGIYSNEISGFGMHPLASNTKDDFDGIRVPRFNKYIDITFEHPEYFSPNFTRDIIPIQNNYVWPFEVASNIEEDIRTIFWNYSKYKPEFDLYLVDLDNNNVVKMSNQFSYSYQSAGKRNFKIIYGNEEFLNTQFKEDNIGLGDAYPNPTNSKTTIPFSLFGKGKTYYVNLDIYNLQGIKIKTLLSSSMQSGVYAVMWDTNNEKGIKIVGGIYLYSLEVKDGDTYYSNRKKIIIR